MLAMKTAHAPSEFGRRNRPAPAVSDPVRSAKDPGVAGTRPFARHRRKRTLGGRRSVMMAVAAVLCVGLGWWCYEAALAHQEFKWPFIMSAMCGMFVVRCLLFLLFGCGANQDDEISDMQLIGFARLGDNSSDGDGDGDGD
jgi:hypothetical protein